MGSGRIDAVILVVNSEEFKAAIQRFLIRGFKQPSFHKAHVENMTVYFAVVGQDDDETSETLNIAIIAQSEMGAFGQANVVATAIKELNPKVFISMGVGWGISSEEKKAKMGDVMISHHIVEFSFDTKIKEDGTIETRSERPAAGKGIYARFSDAVRQWNFTRYFTGYLKIKR